MPLWSPDELSPYQWLDSTDTASVTTVSGAVSQWSDKSGHGRHVTQGTAGKRPGYVSGVLSGHPVIRFDGVDDELTRSAMMPNTFSVFVVADHRDLSETDIGIVSQNSGTAAAGRFIMFIERDSGSIQAGIQLGSAFLKTGARTSDFNLIGCSRASTAATVRFNASEASGSVNSNAVESATYRVGHDGGGLYTQADAAAVVVFDRVLTTAEFELLEGYYAHRCGLTANLPIDHPYKSAPPTIPDARASFGSPLGGGETAVANVVTVAAAAMGSPLGEASAVSAVLAPQANAAFPGTLGEAAAIAEHAVAARSSVLGPLGELSASADVVVSASALVSSPLGAIAALARLEVSAAVVFSGPLGGAAAAVWHAAPAEPAPHAGEASLVWSPAITLGGSDISSMLIGAISIEHSDNEASIAEFSWLPAAAIDPMTIIGQPITIDFVRAGSPPYVRRMFTGVVETPSFDVQTGVVSCVCHDQLQERVAEQSQGWIDAAVGGRWSEAVSGAPADNWEYLQARIASVPKSVAIDPAGAPRVLPWRGAGLATAATYTPADWLDGSLSVSLPSRDSLRTRITCRMQYRYERLRARYIKAEWAQPFSWFVWRDTVGQLHAVTWLTTAMAKSACEGLSGWELIGSVNVTSPMPGVYLAEGWDDGGYVITPDVAPTLALGFESYHAARWQQTMTEDYTVILVNADLEAALGKPIAEEIGANLVAEFDQAAWDSDASVGPGPILIVDPPPAAPPPLGDAVETYQPEGYDPTARDHALRTLLDHAWVKLLQSTRTGRVRFQAPIRPQLWLDWWITIDHPRLRAAGKVVAVSHELDAEAGSAVTTVELAVGLPGNIYQPQPEWSIPAAPVDTSPPGSYHCTIGEYKGGLEDSPPFDEQTMVGFSTNLLDLLTDAEKEGREWYPHQLSIKAPDIEETARDPLTLEAAATIETAIPTDLLEFV